MNGVFSIQQDNQQEPSIYLGEFPNYLFVETPFQKIFIKSTSLF
jgi:hypothetical protein